MATDIKAFMTITEDREDLDLRVRFGLLGTAQEQEAAIVLAFDRYQKPLMAYLRKNFPDLTSDVLASAVQDTFIAVHENAQKIGELTEEIAKALEKTQTKLTWEALRLADRTGGVIEEFRSFVTTLKGKQRLVAGVLADHMPHLLNDREIADEIYERKRIVVPTMEIKGAKAAMFKKFRELIERRLS